MSADQLTSLHTALVDASEGYRKAIEKAEDASLSTEFREVDALHAAAHSDIHGMLATRGKEADDDGSVMGTVHKAVVAVRSAIVGLDVGSLDAFVSGEEHNLMAYEEAIDDESDPSSRQTLAKHRDALAAKVAALKSKAAAS